MYKRTPGRTSTRPNSPGNRRAPSRGVVAASGRSPGKVRGPGARRPRRGKGLPVWSLQTSQRVSRGRPGRKAAALTRARARARAAGASARPCVLALGRGVRAEAPGRPRLVSAAARARGPVLTGRSRKRPWPRLPARTPAGSRLRPRPRGRPGRPASRISPCISHP